MPMCYLLKSKRKLRKPSLQFDGNISTMSLVTQGESKQKLKSISTCFLSAWLSQNAFCQQVACEYCWFTFHSCLLCRISFMCPSLLTKQNFNLMLSVLRFWLVFSLLFGWIQIQTMSVETLLSAYMYFKCLSYWTDLKW